MNRKTSGNSILRVALVAVSLLFQIGWLLLLSLRLNEYSTWISLLSSLLSLVVVLKLYSKHTTSAMKMPWIMLMLALPVMGLSLYLLLQIFGDLGSEGKRLRSARERIDPCLKQDPQVLETLEEQDVSVANQFRYLWNNTHSPVYGNTTVTYYPEAYEAFDALKKDLEQAEHFIFMEYFAVSEESAFREVREILARKVQEGVEVRLLYDDLGSIGYVNFRFARLMNNLGIQCRVFNPALPFLNLFLNHRDHRKITVIDGKVGFTGGFNLADEYFGRTEPFGRWKDTGIRLEGLAVRNLTATFLEMWDANVHGSENFEQYIYAAQPVPARGFVQPFGDNPLEEERAAENVYLNLINSAKHSLYFITPYLIITDEMNRALGLAAKRGVDVRIVTPHIPDKKMVFAITRSYYGGLATQGVRIFEYTPGFCHAKQCLCDGVLASIGTSNLDYRSLYLHFENDVLLYDCDAVERIAADFDALFPQCQEVTEQYRTGRGKMLRLWQYFLRLFAPMM